MEYYEEFFDSEVYNKLTSFIAEAKSKLKAYPVNILKGMFIVNEDKLEKTKDEQAKIKRNIISIAILEIITEKGRGRGTKIYLN